MSIARPAPCQGGTRSNGTQGADCRAAAAALPGQLEGQGGTVDRDGDQLKVGVRAIERGLGQHTQCLVGPHADRPQEASDRAVRGVTPARWHSVSTAVL